MIPPKSRSGKNNPMFGRHLSVETKAKISAAHKGKILSAEHRKKIGNAHRGKIYSEETRKKLSDSVRGEKSYLWKGGITPINHKERNSLKYRMWRESVYKRDDYTCQHCNLRGVRLNVDHIKPFSTHPELRYDITNGRTLCVQCHKKTDTYGRKRTLVLLENADQHHTNKGYDLLQ